MPCVAGFLRFKANVGGWRLPDYETDPLQRNELFRLVFGTGADNRQVEA